MFRALFGLLTYIITGFLLVIVGLSLWSVHIYQASGPLLTQVNFVVERGQGLSTIAQALEQQGIITNRYVFMGAARVSGQQAELKAGEYIFDPAASMDNVLTKLADGKTFVRRLTIPEGRTSFEIVRTLNAIADLSGEIKTIPPEGSLLPNTYDYQLGENRNAILKRMQKNMADAIDNAWHNRIENLPIKTKKEALILASIVEKETGKAEERAIVAGVFINRLRRGIPLQTDPTVIYAITKGAHKNDGKGPLGRRLLSKDLKIQSPYNTYVNAGLPPGPIANPGIDAIKATLNPATHDYIYFVADGTGGHAFGKTLAEHQSNVARWRKIRRAQK